AVLRRWLLALPILGVQWVLFGYSLAFGPTRGGLAGVLAFAGASVGAAPAPRVFFAGCRMVFAVTTPPLVAGALGARMRTSGYVAFLLFWSTLVYDPLVHWLRADG